MPSAWHVYYPGEITDAQVTQYAKDRKLSEGEARKKLEDNSDTDVVAEPGRDDKGVQHEVGTVFVFQQRTKFGKPILANETAMRKLVEAANKGTMTKYESTTTSLGSTRIGWMKTTRDGKQVRGAILQFVNHKGGVSTLVAVRDTEHYTDDFINTVVKSLR